MRFLIIAFTTVLCGCVSTVAELESSAAHRIVTNYTDNYQTIYQRVRSAARDCAEVGVAGTGSIDVDGDLYSELGYGEISNYIKNLGTTDYIWHARIEKTDTGSRMTVLSKYEIWPRWLNGWAASDGHSC